MTDSEANVLSSLSGYQPLVIRASAGEGSAFTLAAWRTACESSALPGFGHAATLAAMSGVVPVCASLSLSAAQLRFTFSVRASVRLSGGFLPAPQPHLAALPSAHQHGLPLAAGASAVSAFTRRFALSPQSCRETERTPNSALQRTGPRVTAAAASRLAALAPLPPSPAQPPRSAGQSLSFGR